MPNNTRERLLKEISKWSTADVVALLEKNELSECCNAVVKRQVDGAELLNLSEGRLNLWKRDLTQHLQWSLCRFVENLNANPKQYCLEEDRPTSPSPDQSDACSDSEELWDTDFEDDEHSKSAGEDSSHHEHNNDSSEMYRNGNSCPPNRASPSSPGNRTGREVEDDNNIYANGPEVNHRPPESTVNIALNNKFSMVAELQQGLQQLHRNKNSSPIDKPSLLPKPKVMEKKPGIIENMKNKPSFPRVQPSLQRPKMNNEKVTPVRPEVTGKIEPTNMQQPRRIQCPPKPKYLPLIIPASDDRLHKPQKPQDLPKPPVNLPHIKTPDFQPDRRTEEADDDDDDDDGSDYEPVISDPQRTGNQYRSSESLRSTASTQSLASHRSKETNESTHYPPSVSNVEDNQDETYESIPHKANDHDEYVKPKCNRYISSTAPRPSPAGSLPKRPVDKPFNTVPNITGQSSRPLPPTPNGSKPDKPVEIIEVPTYMDQPWFHNVGRDEAKALIERGSPRFPNGPPDGYFLLRPSSCAHLNQPWTLVLWYKNKTYNIAVRKRPDFQYALGKVKLGEPPFGSIEEIVNFYKQNELVLNSGSGDTQVGRTRLTETPPK